MSKPNNSNKFQKAHKTNKNRLEKFRPIFIKGIGSVIVAGFSLLAKYQLPQVAVNISTDVCQVDQESKTSIRVNFSVKKVDDLEKSIMPSVNNHE